MRWKNHNYDLISEKIYGGTYSNSYDNVLKIVTVKNSAKYPKKYDNVYANT